MAFQHSQKLGLISLAFLANFDADAADAAPKSQIEARYSREFKQCMSSGDAANGVTSGILECTGAETERQDARLNQAYKMVMARLTAATKASLRTSERKWIADKETRCRKDADAEEGGTMARVIYSACILDETIKRLIWLENYKI